MDDSAMVDTWLRIPGLPLFATGNTIYRKPSSICFWVRSRISTSEGIPNVAPAIQCEHRIVVVIWHCAHFSSGRFRAFTANDWYSDCVWNWPLTRARCHNTSARPRGRRRRSFRMVMRLTYPLASGLGQGERVRLLRASTEAVT